MAHHPSKFVSVNLNKSYGPQAPSGSSTSSGHGRPRPGTGGGMVVLSRPRSSGSAAPKGGPRLAVPAPLNLPSLRKEHERHDPSAGPGTSSGPGRPGSGHGPSAVGWTKPGVAPQLAERLPGQLLPATTAYPSASIVEKAVLLRGEDFPSLSATVASEQKQREFISQRQKQKQPEGDERPELSTPLHMRPQMRSSRLVASTESVGVREPSRPVTAPEPSRKAGSFLPGPLPVIRLAHTSDWADDERDTGLTIPERDRGRGFAKTEPSREHDLPNGHGVRDMEIGRGLSRVFFHGDSFGRDFNAPNVESREVNSWRLPLQQRDGFGSRETGADRIGARPVDFSREMIEGNGYGYTRYADNVRDGFGNGVQDSWYARRDFGSATSTQNGRSMAETFNARGSEQNNRGRYGDNSNSWFKKDTFQSGAAAKGSFSSGSRGFSLNDPILNFGREKRLIPNSGKPYLEDAGLDNTDFLGDVNVKVFKRKKEMMKKTDFHDPVRESFEAELERVQRIQEQERQRAMEEQIRALELARKEQEERERLAREEEERKRRLEEEAREAAWRAEQERLEAARRSEEQKIVREEEKRKILMEEERRKEAARQKLLELEARIARRQAEVTLKDEKILTSVGDEQVPVSVKERDVPRVAEVENGEDGSRPNSSRDGNPSAFMERGKHANYWRRDAYDNGNSSVFHMQDQQNIYHSPRRDAFVPGRGYPRREFSGSPGMVFIRPSSKGGRPETSQMPDDLRPLKGDRWNHFSAGDGDHFNRNSDVDADLLDSDKFSDGGWGPDHSRGSPHAPYGERLFQNSDVDGFSSIGRSRHSVRQPRVLPPPSISYVHRTSLRGTSEYPSSSSILENEMRYQHARRNEEEILQTGYEGGPQECLRQPGSTALLVENAILARQEEKNSPRCDSQSSLSVSSPPSSPTHLSHDDLDESGGSPAPPTPAIGEQAVVIDNEHVASPFEVGEAQIMVTSNSISPGEDDEWAIENNEEMQEQDEYDEEDDGYREEDEAHDVDDENLDLVQELEDFQSDMQQETGKRDQLVGFNEGIEVRIPSNDEFERSTRDTEKAATIEAVPVDAVQELISNGDDSLQSEIVHPEETMNDPSNIINDTEKALQDLVLDPVVTNYLPNGVEASASSPGMPVQQPISPALSSPMLSTPSVHPISSSTSTGASQADVPVKLQFGLFSGPSLIPTPVPAIQIGSIQMPLHLHHQIGPSITQMHPSQPPIFQFGQLRYTPPISQGILPLAPQTLSFVQPPASAHYSLNQNLGGSIPSQSNMDSSPHNNIGEGVHPLPADNLLGPTTKPVDVPQESLDCKQLNAVPDVSKNEVLACHDNIPAIIECQTGYISATSQAECHASHGLTMKNNYRPVANGKDLQTQLHAEPILPQLFPREKAVSGLRASLASGGRGRRLAYAMRNAGSRSSFRGAETLQTNSGGFHRKSRRSIRRTEFRVRDSTERRHTEGVESCNSVRQDEKPSATGRMSEASAKYGDRKDAELNASNKMIESGKINLGVSASRVVGQEIGRSVGKEAVLKRLMPSTDNSHGGEGKRNGNLEEDVDAPLQSGVVRVFKQPGIEAPSDEDDFIEVRSKRQMLNDRREQREKEIKAKSRVTKTSRKHRAVSQSSSAAAISNRAVGSLGGGISNIRSDPIVTDARSLPKADPSPVFTSGLASQTLPPIGTPVVNADIVTRSNTLKSSQTTVSVISNGATKLVPGSSFENKKTAFDNASTPLVSWGNANINHQVMALTQTQLDEAMNPACIESHEESSLETSKQASSIMTEPIKSSTSIMMQENLFSSSASPLSSLLAGEKIQFGAVTSPTVLPPVTQSVSNGIMPPGSCRSDVSLERNLPGTNNDCTIFYDKEKHQDDSCAHLEDPEAEAEAEAAASAVAVAAISNNDEMVGNRLSVSVSDTKSFRTPDTGLTSGGMTAPQEVRGQSASEESLTVALPADLSVDTPSLSLWPPLPSPQSSSGPMLSHFPGAPPSHFPCFEMNPMIGAPIFAFGPHDESAGSQSQVQRSTSMGSGPLGAWPQCHSGVDSFYGPPAGFAGPFISPGGIPSVQGTPHMVVYNHFTPVGQFGQVGLSFMGTTYIPTGKQPDWKHNPVSSAVGVSEGDAGNINVVQGQRNPSSMPPLQHIAPGSPLMPMPSPLAMFDMSPFQSSAEVQMQARWSHISAPPLHAVPLTMPLQQPQVEGGMPSKFSHNMPIDPNTSTGINRFSEPCSSTPSDASKSITVPSDAASQFPDELVLVDPPTTSIAPIRNIQPSYSPASAKNHKGPKSSNDNKSPARNAPPNANQSSGPMTSDSNNGGQSIGSSSKPQATESLSSLGQQYLHQTGHDQRGVGASQKMGAGGEWHRRMGFHGRNQSSGSDKSFGSSKVKQIYVAKQPASGPATPG